MRACMHTYRHTYRRVYREREREKERERESVCVCTRASEQASFVRGRVENFAATTGYNACFVNVNIDRDLFY